MARRQLPIGMAFLMLFLVACEAAEVTPTPRPTWTPRPTNAATPLPASALANSTQLAFAPESVPNIVPGQAATAQTPQAGPRVAAPIPAANDPLLPKFKPFPPVAVPSRPANLNPLTGLSADPAALQRRPLVVRIGNDQKVHTNFWHAGLSQADLVFEELIDILGSQYANSRFSAVFLSNDPVLIGPVRSGRIINFQIAPMIDGALVHAGASNGTRWLFSQSPMINLDEFFNQPAYCYDKEHGYQGRLYTTAPRLHEWLRSKGWEAPVQLYGFNFSDRVAGGQPASSIAFSKSPWPAWNQFQWKYDASSAKYLRWSTGQPHMDTIHSVTAKWGNGADCVTTGKDTQTQISSSNVVVLYAKHEKTNIIEDSNNAVSVHIVLTGEGDALFFRDGMMVRGKWQRNTEQEFFRFTDGSGNPYSLKPGTTWFEIAPLGFQVDIK